MISPILMVVSGSISTSDRQSTIFRVVVRILDKSLEKPYFTEKKREINSFQSN